MTECIQPTSQLTAVALGGDTATGSRWHRTLICVSVHDSLPFRGAELAVVLSASQVGRIKRGHGYVLVKVQYKSEFYWIVIFAKAGAVFYSPLNG